MPHRFEAYNLDFQEQVQTEILLQFVIDDVPLLNFDEKHHLFSFVSVIYKYTDVLMSTILYSTHFNVDD